MPVLMEELTLEKKVRAGVNLSKIIFRVGVNNVGEIWSKTKMTTSTTMEKGKNKPLKKLFFRNSLLLEKRLIILFCARYCPVVSGKKSECLLIY